MIATTSSTRAAGDTYRRPSHAIFILDVSGSMEGERLDALRTALKGLAGSDASLSGRFARFRDREKVTMVTFSSEVHEVKEFTVDDPTPGSADLAAITAFADGLAIQGATAIYSALAEGYKLAATAVEADPSYLTSIVLMTDGENNEGISDTDFLSRYRALPEQARDVRTFTIVFGEADPDALEAISTETGGEVFDARTSPLSEAFKEIRGYQ